MTTQYARISAVDSTAAGARRTGLTLALVHAKTLASLTDVSSYVRFVEVGDGDYLVSYDPADHGDATIQVDLDSLVSGALPFARDRFKVVEMVPSEVTVGGYMAGESPAEDVDANSAKLAATLSAFPENFRSLRIDFDGAIVTGAFKAAWANLANQTFIVIDYVCHDDGTGIYLEGDNVQVLPYPYSGDAIRLYNEPNDQDGITVPTLTSAGASITASFDLDPSVWDGVVLHIYAPLRNLDVWIDLGPSIGSPVTYTSPGNETSTFVPSFVAADTTPIQSLPIPATNATGDALATASLQPDNKPIVDSSGNTRAVDSSGNALANATEVGSPMQAGTAVELSASQPNYTPSTVAQVANIANGTFVSTNIPQQLQQLSTQAGKFKIRIIFNDADGSPANLDSGDPIISLTNQDGTDLSARLTGGWSNPATGEYVIEYQGATADALDLLDWNITGTVNTKLRRWVGLTQLSNTVAADYTAADRARDVAAATTIEALPEFPDDPASESGIEAAIVAIPAPDAATIAAAVRDVDNRTPAANSLGAAVLAAASVAAKFSGITLLKNWLALIMGKTADAETKAEVNATTAGACYDNATMSEEALSRPNASNFTGVFPATVLAKAPAGGSIVTQTPPGPVTPGKMVIYQFSAFVQPGGAAQQIAVVDAAGNPVSLAGRSIEIIAASPSNLQKVWKWTTADALTIVGTGFNIIQIADDSTNSQTAGDFVLFAWDVTDGVSRAIPEASVLLSILPAPQPQAIPEPGHA